MTKDNFPDTIHIGDVTKVSYRDGVLYTENGNYETSIDLIIGGSPCQDFSSLRAMGSNASEIKGLKGDKSSLFYHYLRILNEVRFYHNSYHRTMTIHSLYYPLNFSND